MIGVAEEHSRVRTFNGRCKRITGDGDPNARRLSEPVGETFDPSSVGCEERQIRHAIETGEDDQLDEVHSPFPTLTLRDE